MHFGLPPYCRGMLYIVPRHLLACLTLGLLLSRTLLSPKLAAGACCTGTARRCNRAATELQQSCNEACSRSLLHGHRSSLSDPTNHPFTGSLQTRTLDASSSANPAPTSALHRTLRPYLSARSYSIGSTSCLRTSFLASPAKYSPPPCPRQRPAQTTSAKSPPLL
jgi:hypothetical protein